MVYDKSKILEAKDALSAKLPKGTQIEWGVVLGSGLSDVIDGYEKICEISYGDVPNMKQSKVKGHKGVFSVVKMGGKTVLVMQGRVHMYEGYNAFEVSFPIAVMGEMGIKNVALTNAAGGINAELRPGDIMAISDHINLQSDSPLSGIEDSSKFTDLTGIYDVSWIDSMPKELQAKKGVYVALKGPHYETPAEIRFFRTIGADAVGMSTVMEAILARYYKMRIVGLSMISNLAAGISATALSHSEVTETAKQAGQKLVKIIETVIAR